MGLFFAILAVATAQSPIDRYLDHECPAPDAAQGANIESGAMLLEQIDCAREAMRREFDAFLAPMRKQNAPLAERWQTAQDRFEGWVDKAALAQEDAQWIHPTTRDFESGSGYGMELNRTRLRAFAFQAFFFHSIGEGQVKEMAAFLESVRTKGIRAQWNWLKMNHRLCGEQCCPTQVSGVSDPERLLAFMANTEWLVQHTKEIATEQCRLMPKGLKRKCNEQWLHGLWSLVPG